MISGLGTDIVETDRLEQAIVRHGDDFLKHFLTDAEFSIYQSSGSRLEYAAGRWAAKEAVSKLLGCGIGRVCAWLDMEILNDPDGGPVLTLSGKAAETAKRLGVRKIWISISHERHYAVATAIGESEK